MTRRIKAKRLAQFAAIALLAGEASYVAAEVLVLRSAGPSARRYPAGQRLPDNASFTLRPGDSVVVLAGGGTRTFRGPGTFSVTGPVRGIASSGIRRNTGAVRGQADSDVRQPDNFWHVDVTMTGRACVAAGARPTLWRPSAQSAVQLTITPQSGPAQTVNWPAGQATLAWPASIPVADGGSYQLSWTGAASPTRLTLRSVPALPPSDVEGVASALISNQCRGQLDVLIAQREVRDTAAGATTGGVAQ